MVIPFLTVAAVAALFALAVQLLRFLRVQRHEAELRRLDREMGPMLRAYAASVRWDESGETASFTDHPYTTQSFTWTPTADDDTTVSGTVTRDR